MSKGQSRFVGQSVSQDAIELYDSLELLFVFCFCDCVINSSFM